MSKQNDRAFNMIDDNLFTIKETEDHDLILTFNRDQLFEEGENIIVHSSHIYQKGKDCQKRMNKQGEQFEWDNLQEIYTKEVIEPRERLEEAGRPYDARKVERDFIERIIQLKDD